MKEGFYTTILLFDISAGSEAEKYLKPFFLCVSVRSKLSMLFGGPWFI